MKKTFLLSFLILIFTVVLTSGATAATFEILTGQPESSWGNGTTNPQDPFNTYYHDSRAQAVYLASELTAAGMTAGTISEIQLKDFQAPGQNLEDFRIRIQHTTNTESTVWVASGWDLVYGPTTISAASLSPDNWYTFTLATPFDWNGTDNLLIDFTRDNSSYTSSGGMYVRTGLFNRMCGGLADSWYAWPFDGMSESVYSQVPSIKFTTAPGSPVASSVTDLPAPADPGDTVTFTGNWNINTTGANVKMYVCKDAACSNCNSTSQTNCWCYSSAWNTEPDTTDTCTYTIQVTDPVVNNYWLGACDDGGLCDPEPLNGGVFGRASGWAKTFGDSTGINHEYIRSLQITSDEGYIITGYSEAYGSGPIGWSDIMVMKLDSDGNQTWTKTFGENGVNELAQEIQQTSDGGYILAGGSNTIVLKLNATGTQVWAKDYSGTHDLKIQSIKEVSTGGYIIAGLMDSYGSQNSENIVIKLDSAGVPVWNKTYGGICSNAFSVIEDSDGNFVVGGGTQNFGNGSEEFLIVKLDSDGNHLWAKTIGDTGWDKIGWQDALKQTSDGGYVIAGYTTSFGVIGNDFLIVKLDSNGDHVWTTTYGGDGSDEALAVHQTLDGGYIIAGETNSDGFGIGDVLVLRLDSDGHEVWAKVMGGTRRELPYVIRQTADGGYILGGGSQSFIVGDNSDWFVVKLDSNGDITGCPIPDVNPSAFSISSPSSTVATAPLVYGSSPYTASAVTLTTSDVVPGEIDVCPGNVPNSVPSASSVSDAPDPVDVGSNITFNGNWSEPDTGDNVKMYVCKDATCSNCNSTSQANCWCYSSAWNTEPDTTDTCAYTALLADVGSNGYWLGVCDDSNDCDASPLQGDTFTVNAPASFPSVTTNIANSIDRWSAQLNASLTDLGGTATTTVWFEWEQSDVLPAVYNNTIFAVDPIKDATGAFYADLSGLTPGASYYFRAAGQNSAGTNYGDGEQFFVDAHNFPTIASAPISIADENICKIVGTETVCKSGEIITFESVASDLDSDNISLYICKDATCSNCLPGDITGCWNDSSVAFATNPSATYDSMDSSVGCEYALDQEYWAKVCDEYDYCSDIIGG